MDVVIEGTILADDDRHNRYLRRGSATAVIAGADIVAHLVEAAACKPPGAQLFQNQDQCRNLASLLTLIAQRQKIKRAGFCRGPTARPRQNSTASMRINLHINLRDTCNPLQMRWTGFFQTK